MKKIILDLCGGTGSWSEPYRKNGYDVRLITLPKNDVRTFEPPKMVYGILCAPPCTQFSLARSTAKIPRDFKKGLEAVDGCLRIIRICKLNGGLKFWAMENPVGFLRQFLGIPSFTFNPYDFGDPWTKPTDLWGYYRRPKFNFCRPQYDIETAVKVKLGAADWMAVTPPGFSTEFFRANR
jgi:hypothetical protein